MSAANPNPMEKSMGLVLVVANARGGSPLPYSDNLDNTPNPRPQIGNSLTHP
jgi:hypothetical protein